jgi:hypothetical protein
MAAKYEWAVGAHEQHVSGNKGMHLAVEWENSRCWADDALFSCILILNTCLIHILTPLFVSLSLGSACFRPPSSVFAVLTPLYIWQI